MARHIWSVLCHKGVLDKTTNQVSLLDVLETATGHALEPEPTGPNVAVPIQLHLVVLWMRSDFEQPETADVRFRIVAPNGDILVEKEHKVDLTEHIRSRTFLRMDSLLYRGSGYYNFVSEMKNEEAGGWRVVSDVPFEFKLQPFSQLTEQPVTEQRKEGE